MPKKEEDFSESESTTSDASDDGSEESSSTTESESEDSEENFTPAQSKSVKNRPHDEEFSVGANASRSQGAPAAAASSSVNRAPAAQGTTGGQSVQNMPHDEEFSVSKTGARPSAASSQGRPAGASSSQKPVGSMIQNDTHDEFVEVEDDMEDDVPTPQKGPTASSTSSSKPAPTAAGGKSTSTVIQNEHHDEEIVIKKPSAGAQKPLASSNISSTTSNRLAAQPSGMAPPPESDEDEESGETGTDDDDEDLGGPKMKSVPSTQQATTASSVDYNPAEYAHITNSVPAEVRDLFAYITAYHANTYECPAKLKPFVPDFIPSVGDIDTFCKVPRPDDKADNFGLIVIDEPSSKMSNPAIVTATLAATENVTSIFTDKILDSLEDAVNRPQAIDRWINELREAQHKKAPPTVYYTKPMPSIESLMQEWPPGFEAVLNSDLQLPPPGIDLDIEQYVRLLCAVLDIPVHSNLVESLHVMFTLYLEFRENQHFKAA